MAGFVENVEYSIFSRDVEIVEYSIFFARCRKLRILGIFAQTQFGFLSCIDYFVCFVLHPKKCKHICVVSFVCHVCGYAKDPSDSPQDDK